MTDNDPEPATRARGNVRTGGRYGTAPDDKKHLEPEMGPARGGDAEVRLPEALPGMLDENDAEPKE